MTTGDKMALTLRPAEAHDAPALIAAHLASRALHGQWVQPFTTLEGFEVWFAPTQGEAPRKVALLAESAGALVGVVNLNEIVRGGFLSCYMGYYRLAAPEPSRGRMTEAVRLALAHAFGPLGLHRVEANIQPANHRSIALVRRLGFRLEGLSRNYLRIAGAWRDHERWALLAEDAGKDILGQC
jgi:ribosomal-protein-alanine N-acetyltransferase